MAQDTIEEKACVALTMGDPAGIGLEISLKAWEMRLSEGLHPFCLIGDAQPVSELAAKLNIATPVKVIDHFKDAAKIFSEGLPVLSQNLQISVEPGKPESEAATAIVESIEKAVKLVTDGQAAAVVTNPIAKSVLYAGGFKHPGHTEFLGELAQKVDEHRSVPVMMLASEQLRVVPVTIHIPLEDVPQALTKEAIESAIRITAQDLKYYFNIDAPRIAVTGLNPHAGENGSLGTEEIETVIPAIEQLKSEGLDVGGPYPADTIFHARARKTYDAVVAMYHDQALIPIKTLDFDKGVNVTLGLPFIRTSPDHGVAFDIAGQGIANPQSLVEAIKLAHAMALNTRKTNYDN